MTRPRACAVRSPRRCAPAWRTDVCGSRRAARLRGRAARWRAARRGANQLQQPGRTARRRGSGRLRAGRPRQPFHALRAVRSRCHARTVAPRIPLRELRAVRPQHARVQLRPLHPPVRHLAGPTYAATAGNFEATFGRGLVLRAFALPGVIREERGTPQYGDLRDLDGVRAEVRVESGRGNLEATVLQGRPRYSDETPTTPRHGSVEGAASVSSRGTVRAGAHYVRIDSQLDADPGNTIEVGGGFVQVGFDRGCGAPAGTACRSTPIVEAAGATGLGLPPAGQQREARPRPRPRRVRVADRAVDDVLPDCIGVRATNSRTTRTSSWV